MGSSGAHDGHLAGRRRRIAFPDVETARGLDGEVRLSGEQLLERSAVVGQERALEGWLAGKPLS